MAAEENTITTIVVSVFIFIIAVLSINILILDMNSRYSSVAGVTITTETYNNIQNDSSELAEIMNSSLSQDFSLSTMKDVGLGVVKSIKIVPTMFNSMFQQASVQTGGLVDSHILVWAYFGILVMFTLSLIFIIFKVFL